MKQQPTLNPSNTAKRRWEALILFGLNFNELLVETTMGPVMSHTIFKITGAVSQGHVEVDSEGNKDVLFKLGMDTCQFEAKQGMVGCLLTLNATESFGHIVRLKDRTPQHRFGGSVDGFCIRVDWLTYTKFIGKVTHLAVELHDLWSIDASSREGKSVVEKCTVSLNSDVKWDSIFLMITRTTVNDFIRVYDKLCEFFAQQVKASRMVLIPEAAMTTAMRITTSQYGGAANGQRSGQKALDATLVMASELCYHEHWNTALELITKIQNRVASFFPLPKETTVLGGNFEFNCREIALACFHGLNFTSEKWLIFYLLEAHINFSAEAKDIALGNNLAVKVLQNLTFRLEKDRLQLSKDKPKSPDTPMGTILRVSRNGPFYPPQGSTIEQWLSYTFTSVLTESHGLSVTKDRWTQKASSNLVDFLFKMPALRFNQKSDHEQPSSSINNKNHRPTEPVVKCSLVAGFDGYILITQQLDAIMTLADMVRSYLTEMGPLLGTPPVAQSSEPPDPMQRVKDDARRFFTVDWQVDPLQINFITLGEKQSSDKWIKIDKFLEKGLEHAFTTMGFTDPKQIIPQWIQRGCMDPLDSFMATLIEKVLKLSENNE
uniref:Bridge-like lipid transfer protein family member 1 C-terminal domain-containing protein n=1 Tax=Romanomermis culicivorax TaxID=13658 RepID=A0A915K8F3_ROMCU